MAQDLYTAPSRRERKVRTLALQFDPGIHTCSLLALPATLWGTSAHRGNHSTAGGGDITERVDRRSRTGGLEQTQGSRTGGLEQTQRSRTRGGLEQTQGSRTRGESIPQKISTGREGTIPQGGLNRTRGQEVSNRRSRTNTGVSNKRRSRTGGLEEEVSNKGSRTKGLEHRGRVSKNEGSLEQREKLVHSGGRRERGSRTKQGKPHQNFHRREPLGGGAIPQGGAMSQKRGLEHRAGKKGS